tara:strand:+ start:114059 stop:114652 length:594 start_codon:yes stop_codon:yes gene_type:complete
VKLSKLKSIVKEEIKTLLTNTSISKHLEYHLENHSTLVEGVFRYGSDAYLDLFQEARTLHAQNKIQLSEIDQHLIENTDIGTWGEYNKMRVPLDCPFQIHESEYQGKDVELNKPKRGGDKKFYVYVKDPKTKNIRKVSFGDTTGLSVKFKDPVRRKAFADRHNCSTKKDKTKAGYWSCNLPRYAKQLGMGDNQNTYW